MIFRSFVDNLDPGTIDKLKTAVEIGRWESGDKLTDDQRNYAMQAVMLWQAKHEAHRSDEPFTIDSNGEYRIGKGKKLSDVPLEFKKEPELILKTRV